jgi:DNA-directed RNA polymerase specialized sigma24 family protein
MAFSDDQIRVATRAWLDATRREALKRNPDVDFLIPTWQELTVSDRQSMKRCVESALKASDPKNVAAVMARDAEEAETRGG